MALDPDDMVACENRFDDLPPAPSRTAAVAGYDLLEEIGSGGTGVVYRARDRKLGRTVALKLLRAGALAGADQRARFLREARAGAGLQHPAIVQVFEVGEHEGCPYLALEFVEGETLSRRLVDGPLSPRAAAALVEQLAHAVAFAHARGVVHRDLKPANVLLANSDSPKIADFGLARISEDSVATEIGTVLGTPAYMAPEQAAGRGAEAGPPADTYALGAILFECLAGRPPFHGPTPIETLRRVLSDEPSLPSHERPTVPRDLDTIALTCLSKEPLRRYSSAAALANDLRRFLDGRPILARPIGVWGRCWRWAQRNPRVAALLVLLAIALGAVALQWRRSERLFALADSERAVAEEHLHRFQAAADEFAGLLDQLDTNQLFNLRSAPLRRELLLPALQRTQTTLERVAADPNRQSEVVQAHFRIAILTRLLSNDIEPRTRRTALEAGRLALAELGAFAEHHPDSVQFRRDRAALTHNQGYLLHAMRLSADALPVLESACRQRQELLDGQPTHAEFRSELAGCWNDVGLALEALDRSGEALAALDRAVALQSQLVTAAPDETRYRRLLANHHFNRATSLCRLGRMTEAIAAAATGPQLLPYDPEQRFREARILAQLVNEPDGERYAAAAVATFQRALDLGLDDPERILRFEYFETLKDRADYRKIVQDLQRRSSSAAASRP